MTTRLIMDTDTAGDDCIALMVGLLHPRADLRAITIVAGNLPFQEQVSNALLAVEVSGRSQEVPVYLGAQRPLLNTWVSSSAHGDGRGGWSTDRVKQAPAERSAVQALLDITQEQPTSIVAIGPLTNIATACLADPDFASRVDELIVMGGTHNGRGNITPSAEYNFYVDPEAAQIVMQAGFDNLTLVTWTATLEYAVLDAVAGSQVVTQGTLPSAFFTAVNAPNAAYNAEKDIEGSTHPDTLAALTLLVPEVVRESIGARVDVEVGGERSRGACVTDPLHTEPNAMIPIDYDREMFIGELARVLSSGPSTGRHAE